MRRRWLALSLLLVALAGAAAFALLRPSRESAEALAPGKRALVPVAKRRTMPRVAAPALLPPPATISLPPAGGKPLFVSVWASWCLPCRVEAPLLARLARTYGRAINFRGINVEDRRGDARAFVRRFHLDFPHLFDPKARTAEALGFFGLPTVYLVDRHGRIATRIAGKQPQAILRQLLQTLEHERT